MTIEDIRINVTPNGLIVCWKHREVLYGATLLSLLEEHTSREVPVDTTEKLMWRPPTNDWPPARKRVLLRLEPEFPWATNLYVVGFRRDSMDGFNLPGLARSARVKECSDCLPDNLELWGAEIAPDPGFENSAPSVTITEYMEACRKSAQAEKDHLEERDGRTGKDGAE